MKNTLILALLLTMCSFAKTQEGFWNVEQLSDLQPKLAQAGLHFSDAQISMAKRGGFAQSVIRFRGGNAFFINKKRLAIGMLEAYQIPDSVWSQMKDGVWIAPPGQGIKLQELNYPVVFLESDTCSAPLDHEAIIGVVSAYYEMYTRTIDIQQQKWYNQNSQYLGEVELIGAFKGPALLDTEPAVGVILRIHDNVAQLSSLLDSLTYLPYSLTEPGQTSHLVLGYPSNTSIHRSSFNLQYARALSKCNQQLDKSLGAYLTRSPFITQEGVFRHFENLNTLDQALSHRARWDAELRHALSNNSNLKTQYGSILDSCQLLFKELQHYAPAQVYTKGIVYSPCSFFESVRLFTMWRGRMGSSVQRYPSAEESQYFPEVFKRVPPTENELLLPELLQLYFTQLPAEHLSPFAIQQAIYAQKDYYQMSETLLRKSLFNQTEQLVSLLEEDFLLNIEMVAKDPAVQLVDSMLTHYARSVVPRMEQIRQKALKKEAELIRAMDKIVPNYPAYTDADHSLRISYGTVLEAPTENRQHYWLSNAHLTESHRGSPVINGQGQIFGMVQGLSSNEHDNAYHYDPEKSRTLIWRIDKIRERIAAHPNGHFIISEWP